MRMASALTAVSLWLGAGLISAAMAAGAYPDRPVKLIVPFPAGGATDLMARSLAQGLGEKLGQTVVVENRGGAGGAIGAEAVATAAPDGYTLLYSTMGVLTINPSLYPKLRYDPQRSFAPVSLTNLTSNLLVVNPSLKVDSVAELAELARQRPGELTFSSSGNGTTSHLAGEMLSLIHIFRHVPDDRYFVAPSLTWRPSGATELTLLANFQRDDTGTMVGFFPWRGTRTDSPAGRIPQDFFVSEPDFDRFRTRQSAAGYQFEHAFNDRVTIHQSLRYSHSDADYRSIYTTGFNGAGHGWVPGSDTLLRRVVYMNQPTLKQLAVDTHARFKFDTAAVRHTLLAGIDYQRSTLEAQKGVGGVAAPIDVYNPVYGNFTPPTSLRHMPTSHENQIGFYAQDQLEWQRWLLMLGLRYDRSRAAVDDTPSGSRDDSELTRRFGLMYRAAAGFNPYVSYAESFQGQAGFNHANQAFKPLRGKQWEAGVKYQPPGHNMTVTASLFDMTEANRKVAGVVNGVADTVQVGEARTRGAELEALASLGGVDVVATWTLLNAKVTRGIPAEQGRQLARMPRHMASLWVNHRFRLLGAPGFLAGAGVRYTGASDDGTGHNGVPAVTVYDAVLAYDAGPMRLALNVTNLFDKQYVGSCIARGDCFFGTRRNVVGSVTYRF